MRISTEYLKREIAPHLPSEKMNKGQRIGVARALCDIALGHIRDALKRGEVIVIDGIGRFKVVQRAAKKGRNPKTGEAVAIRARKAIKFKPAQALADLVNPGLARERERAGK